MEQASAFDKVDVHLTGFTGLVTYLSTRLVEHLRLLTVEINELATELTRRITDLAPSLLAIPGCGPLTAAKIIAETADVRRFRSKDAFARHNGTAPCRCGRRIMLDIDSRAAGIASSTRPCTASR